MLFRLTFLLVAGLILLMYFAPDPDPGTRAAVRQDAAQAKREAEAEAQAEVPPAPRAPQAGTTTSSEMSPDIMPDTAPDPAPGAAPEAQTSAGPAPQTQGDLADAVADALADVAASESDGTAADGASGDGTDAQDAGPLTLPGLTLGTAERGGTAGALSLSERLRDRPAGQAADPAAPLSPREETPAPLIPRAEGSGAEQRAQVVGTSVNLRSGPSTADPVVGRVDFNDQVVYLGEPVPGWASIRNPETGQTAYMASRFLQRLGN